MKRLIAPGVVYVVTLLVAGCGGGGGGGSAANGASGGTPTPQVPQPPPPEEPPPAAAPTAVNVAFKDGDFLDFYASTQSSTVAQGQGGSTDEDAARFRVTLGAPHRMADADLFPLTISGRTVVGGHEFAPRWKFIGSAGGKLLGSIDGQTVQTVYSPDGKAAGFFATREAVAGETEPTNFTGDYVKGRVIRMGNAKGSGGCQIIAGIRACSDDSANVASYEYFMDGIGPFGFLLATSASSSGGGFYTSSSNRDAVELIATSLTAEQITFDNAPAEAASMRRSRYNPLATAYGGKIYVFGRTAGAVVDAGGESSIEVYDPAANSWAEIGQNPFNLGDYAVVTIADKSYFVGNGATRVYDHVTTAWSTPNNSNPIESGGSNDGLAWKLGTRIQQPGLSSLLLVQKRWVASAGTAANDTRFLMKSYSLATNVWTTIGEFTVAGRTEFDTMSIVGDRIFITAGRTRAPIRVDVGALQYTDTGMTMSPHDRTVTAASVELNGKVYCFGGEGVNSSGNRVGFRRDSEYYDTATDTWTVIPKLLLAREFSTAVALNGKLYVLGGRVRGNLKTDRVEVYTP